MSMLKSLEAVQNTFKDKCPKCMGELVFLASCKNSSDYIVMCMSTQCGFLIVREGNFSFYSSG